MLNNDILEDDAWFEQHQQDFLKIEQLLEELNNDKKVQRVYNKYIKQKIKNNIKINYNNKQSDLNEYKQNSKTCNHQEFSSSLENNCFSYNKSVSFENRFS